MQPFTLAEQLQTQYLRYIHTAFPMRRPALLAEFERLVYEEKLLWREPFISLSPTFQPGGTLTDLVNEGVLSPQIHRAHWGFDALHAHQAQAARHLSTLGQPRNTLVATGTGSGKTEAFLIPIIDHCLRTNTSGVQAILLYPMNALINDQLKRLRHLLRGTGVRFGRYTGDTPRDAQDAQSRNQLPPADMPAEETFYRDDYQDPARIPHILLTNYTMLELLLLRKRDRAIFRGQPPRYVVLDEIHTYTGILGTEVACLLRRLKEHTGASPGQLICVGTSATAKTAGQANAESDLARFASELFAESFTADSVINEHYQPPPFPATRVFDPSPHLQPADVFGLNLDDLATVRQLAHRLFGVALSEAADPYAALYDLCAARWIFAEIEELLRQPQSFDRVVELLAVQPERAGIPLNELRAEATALLLLGTVAQRPMANGEPEPRFRPKVHMQIRSLTPLNRCLDDHCQRLLTDNRATCDHPATHAAPQRALPLGLCRLCGADYVLGQFSVPEHASPQKGKHSGKTDLKIDDLGPVQLFAFEPHRPDPDTAPMRFATLYLYPGPAADLVLDEDGVPVLDTQVYHVCPTCGQATPASDATSTARCHDPHCANHQRDPLPRFIAFLGGAKCPVCQAQGRGPRPEIITPLRSGAVTTVAVLAQTLLPLLTEDSEKRLLIFADSRQDTAHQAGYLRDRHQVFTQRQLVYQMLRAHEAGGGDPLGLPQLARAVFLNTRTTQGEVEAYNLLTSPAYATTEAFGFLESTATLSKGQTDKAIDRLQWDLALEFTDRANTRNSLEREGLTTVQYARLAEAAAHEAARFAAFGLAPEALTNLLRAVLDFLRQKRAITYAPFRQYLGDKADMVLNGIARPTRHTRTPVAIDSVKASRSGAYEILQWYNRDHPAQHPSALYNLVARVTPHLDATQVTALIDALAEVLQNRQYLQRITLGQTWQTRGGLTSSGWQVNETLIEVTTRGERYRCPTCRAVHSYQLRASTGEPVCATYRCKGQPVLHTSADNFYARLYADGHPERLYPMEHSGQLSGKEREDIERKFNANLVNALVCTPTLELGVDIGDLAALVMRNIPPTPSNYAQRAGRAGRRRRVALILSHSGQGAHDSYFYTHPEEMIAGAIRPPVFLLDNRVVIDRHLNSLIFEKLDAAIPSQWNAIRTETGELRLEVLTPFETELAQRGGIIQTAVEQAFVHDLAQGGLAWLTAAHVTARLNAFVGDVRAGLEHWCRRYREIYTELARSRQRTIPGCIRSFWANIGSFLRSPIFRRSQACVSRRKAKAV